MSSSSKTGTNNANLMIADDYEGKVVFNGESAGYQNAVGMYTYDDAGKITGVKIIWANASLAGSGGNLVANSSSAALSLHSGEHVGFFVVPDAFSQAGMAKLLADTAGSFKLVDAKGNPGSVEGGVELKLVHVSASGKETDIKSAYGTSLFHSTDDGSKGLNGDKLNHVVTTVNPTTGNIKIGFEDLKGGGDKDYDDAVITVNVGADNAKLIAAGAVESTLQARAEEAAAVKAAAEKAEADRLAAEKAAAEKAEADRLAAEKAAAEKAEADRLAAEKAAAEKAEADRLAAEKAAAEKAEADRLAAEKAAAEKAEADRLAAEKAAAEKAEADRLAAEKAAAEKAEADRLAAEKAAAEKAEADRLAAEKAAAEKAEADRLAAEKAAAEKAEADRLAAEKAAAEKAEADRLAAEKAAAEKAEADRLAAEKAAADKAETDRLAAEKAAADKAEADRLAAEKAAADKAEADRLAAEKAAAEKAEADRLAAEKAEADRLAAEKVAAEKAEADRLAAEKLVAEKAAVDAAEAAKHAAGELLVDGSFEQADVAANTWSHFKSVGGWKSDTEVEVWGKDFLGIKATDGVKHAELDFDGRASNIYQDVATEAGKSYTFTFDYAQRAGTAAASNTIEVFWNGKLVGTVEPTSTNWAAASFEVVGTGGSDRIEFREQAGDNDTLGGLIDNASLRATPIVLPPDALALKVADVAKTVSSDVLTGNSAADALVGGAGNDQLFGKGGSDVLDGDAGGKVTAALDIAVNLVDADSSRSLSLTLSGMPAGAQLSAGKDNGDGTWTLTAGDLEGLTVTADDGAHFSVHVVASATDPAGDVLTQSADINVVFDGGNQDLVVGGKGDDVANGGLGDDVVYGGSVPTGVASSRAASYADNDVVHGNDGNDRVYGNTGDDQVFGDDGDDFVSGGKGNDFVSGGNGNDIVEGNSGDDIITADAGDDQISGGSGFDTLDFSMSSKGLVVDMAAKTATGMGRDTIDGIEKVIGSAFDDVFVGDGKDNVFVGGDGNDRMSGAKGNDTMSGGDGSDTFSWTKSDVYNFKAQTGWVDTITDFQVGDKLELTGFFQPGTVNVAGLVSVTDGANGSTVSVKFGGEFHAVALLDGVHNLSASEMLKDGMLFVA